MYIPMAERSPWMLPIPIIITIKWLIHLSVEQTLWYNIQALIDVSFNSLSSLVRKLPLAEGPSPTEVAANIE